MRWKPVIIVAVVTALVAAVLAAGFGTDPRAVPSVLIDTPAPACTLTSLEGEPTTLAELRGKPVLINFWSTWCVPCKTEHELLQWAAKSWGDEVEFVGIVYQDELEAARAYLTKRGNRYRQLMDPDSACAIDFGVAGVPETFFIDAGGVIKLKQAGAVTPAVLQHALRSLTGEKS